MATADVEPGLAPDSSIHSGPRSHRDRRFPRRVPGEPANTTTTTTSPRGPPEQRGRRTRADGGGRTRRQPPPPTPPPPPPLPPQAAAVGDGGGGGGGVPRRTGESVGGGGGGGGAGGGVSRRTGESPLLPPIKVTSGRDADVTPTREVQASPTSNVSFHGGSLAEEESGIHLAVLASAAPAEGGGVRSPVNRRDSQSIMSLVEAWDTPCLSPAALPDSTRLKTGRRRMKCVNDVAADAALPAKTPAVDSGTKATTKTKTSRRVSLQSLPKLTLGEEPFSIRKKIEQFRKWHEEQYTEKLKKLKVEAEKEKKESAPQVASRVKSVEIDFSKILEENMKCIPRASKKAGHRDSNRVTELEDTLSSTRKNRCTSSSTWRTWRDVNDSYAYDDVKQYIQDNELLPADRVDWINSWLGDVEKAFGAGGDGEESDPMADLTPRLAQL